MYDPTKPYKEAIQEAIQKTWRSEHASAAQLPGSPYPLIMRNNLRAYSQEVDHTDGIGTKGILHMRHRTFAAAVQDALAMNLNDLLVMRATPYKLQNHLTLDSDDQDAILEVISSLSEECIKRKIILTGGETSIHDTMQGMDLSITVTGFAGAEQNEFCVGDKLIGLRSTGIHANGFTLARQYLGINRKDLTIPTRIYWDDVNMWKGAIHKSLHGMVHIAGGAWSRLLGILTDNQCVTLNQWPSLPIFDELYGHVQDDKIMYKVFNCGMGMVLSVAPEDAEDVASLLDANIIGEVAEGPKAVRIHSIFTGEKVEFK